MPVTVRWSDSLANAVSAREDGERSKVKVEVGLGWAIDKRGKDEASQLLWPLKR